MTKAESIARNQVALSLDGLITTLLAAKVSLQEWLRRRETYRRTVRELSAQSDRDLADIGIYRTDIRAIARDVAFGE